MIIAWENKADEATITTDSEIATLPASNVQQPHLAKKWHTTAGDKDAYLIFDMGASGAASVVAVLGTNLTAAATIQIRASDSDPTVTSSLAYDSGVVAGGAKAGYGAIYKAFTEATARYWRIDLADTGVDSNLQVGRVFVGPAWTPSIAQQLPWSVRVVDPSDRTRSYGGQLHFDERPQYRVISFSIDFIDEDEMFDNAFALARSNGLVRDVLAINDASGSYLSEQAVFGPLLDLGEIVNDKIDLWRVRFLIEERL